VTAPHDRPTAAELVEAVREFLAGDVAPRLEGRDAFQLRIALNALAMVERELDVGPAHADRLAALGVADDGELAAAIRAGRLDDRWDEVVAAVRAAVVDKLAVVHPGYTDPDT
jgi:hypothetical protein